MKKILPKKGNDGSIRLKRVDAPAEQAVCTMNVYGNLWVVEVNLPEKGSEKGMHKHEFDHRHLIVKGSAKILTYADDKKTVLTSEEAVAPQWLEIPKDTYHNIIALEDETIGYCIHAMRNQDDEVISSDYTKGTE